MSTTHRDNNTASLNMNTNGSSLGNSNVTSNNNNNINNNDGVGKKLSYYDVIAALSTLECSQDVIFTPDELKQLTKQTKTQSLGQRTSFKRSKSNIHGYLGGKLNVNEVSIMDCDLSHTLMGGYVPQTQLETLCSTNFADLFHKQLNCSDLLQVHDIFNKDILSPSMRSSGASGSTNIDNIGGNNTSTELNIKNTNSSTQLNVLADGRDPVTDPKVYQWTNTEGKTIRKIVVCRRCNAKFYGAQRLKQLQQHNCKK